jgi:hypothetical protein
MWMYLWNKEMRLFWMKFFRNWKCLLVLVKEIKWNNRWWKVIEKENWNKKEFRDLNNFSKKWNIPMLTAKKVLKRQKNFINNGWEKIV